MKTNIEITIDPKTMEIVVENAGGATSADIIQKIEDALGLVTSREVHCAKDRGLETKTQLKQTIQ